MQANPMENVFIKMVRKISEEIPSIPQGETSDKQEQIKLKLQKHLEKAERLAMLSYEGEVRNVMAVCSIRFEGDFESAATNLQRARACAKQMSNVDLEIRTLNTIAGSKMLAHDYDSAVDTYQETIDLINSEDLATPHIYVLPAYLNIAGNSARKGKWTEVKEQVDMFHKLIEGIVITAEERRIYARAIYYMRLLETQVALAYEDDSIESNIRLIKELASQLEENDVKRYLSPFEQLSALFSTKDEDTFMKWYIDFKENQAINAFDHSTYACILQKRGYSNLATVFANDLLNETPNEAVQEIYRQDLSAVGIQSI
ncbi:MAG: hypothetical protein AAFR81_28810 [Chloroflexota bacterium]